MKTMLSKRFPRTERWLKYRLAPRALILMYHRVTELANDPHLLAVTPLHFAEHLEIIRQHTTPVNLQQLVEALHRGKVPNRAVVITFDDGYADNLHQAKPLLERFEIPATVFVTAGQVDSQREFWWDELDRLLLQPVWLPDRLQLEIAGTAYVWESWQKGEYTQQDYQRDRSWHIERQDEPHPRHRLFRTLFERLQSAPVEERQRVLESIRLWSGAEPIARPTHRALSSDEVLLLAQDDLIEVGAHSMTHPNLAALDEAGQRAEIRQSRECLEAMINRPVTSFAYPNGFTTQESAVLLREARFTSACSSESDAVWRDADVFHMPRLGVRDWDQETFALWLKYWFDG